jgi:hypothetical protein
MSPRATGSDRARRTAIRLLRWYPRPWRKRYEREMRVLLEDMPVGWMQVGNLAATAAREWMSPRALGWPARSAAGRLQTARMITFVTYAFVIDGIARIVAARMVAGHFTISDTVETIIVWFQFVPLVRIAVAIACMLKRVRRSRLAATIDRHPWLQYLSDWEVVAWLTLYFPMLVLRHAEPIPRYYTDTMRALKPFENVYLVWLSTYVLMQRNAVTVRIRKIQTAFINRPKVWPPRTPEFWQ